MELIFYFILLLVASFSRGSENRETSDGNEKEEDDYELGSSNIITSGVLNGKSAYSIPGTALPPGYAAYLANLGYGIPYPYGSYNRYSALPYSNPYGYGALLNNPAFASALMSGGLPYPGYGSPYLGRSLYPGFGYGYPGYIPGLGYPPASLRRGPVPVASAPAPVVGVAPSVARSVAPLPAPVASAVPPPLSSVPVPAFLNTIPGVPAPVSGVPGYRAPFRPVQSKDGTVRYIPVDAQNFLK